MFSSLRRVEMADRRGEDRELTEAEKRRIAQAVDSMEPAQSLFLPTSAVYGQMLCPGCMGDPDEDLQEWGYIPSGTQSDHMGHGGCLTDWRGTFPEGAVREYALSLVSGERRERMRRAFDASMATSHPDEGNTLDWAAGREWGTPATQSPNVVERLRTQAARRRVFGPGNVALSTRAAARGSANPLQKGLKRSAARRHEERDAAKRRAEETKRAWEEKEEAYARERAARRRRVEAVPPVTYAADSDSDSDGGYLGGGRVKAKRASARHRPQRRQRPSRCRSRRAHRRPVRTLRGRSGARTRRTSGRASNGRR